MVKLNLKKESMYGFLSFIMNSQIKSLRRALSGDGVSKHHPLEELEVESAKQILRSPPIEKRSVITAKYVRIGNTYKHLYLTKLNNINNL